MANSYVDFTSFSGNLTGTWTFTNGNNAVIAVPADGNALVELAVDNYIRMSDGVQWYRVVAIPNKDTITISIVFQQVTHVDDLNASLYNAETGAFPMSAFAHINQATLIDARVAGDIVRVRANQIHTYSGDNIFCDYDGTRNNYIELRACTIADDHWGDASDVKPILDFADTRSRLHLFMDDYWEINGFEIIQADQALGPDGGIQIDTCVDIIIENCTLRDNGIGSGCGIVLTNSPGGFVKDCIFYLNTDDSIYVEDCEARIEGCTFDGGSPFLRSRGLGVRHGTVRLKNCTFGATTPHDRADIEVGWGVVEVTGRNVTLDSATEVNFLNAGIPANYFVRLEDDEQTHLAFRAWFSTGNLERSTAVERSDDGGTSWSILGEPNVNCGADQPLYIMGDWLRGVPIYLDGTEQTITIYAYATSWAGLPTVSQFVVELEHYEGLADWDIDISSDTFDDNDQWESFSITLTPGASGPAYLRIYLKDYEDGTEQIYIDPKPVIYKI